MGGWVDGWMDGRKRDFALEIGRQDVTEREPPSIVWLSNRYIETPSARREARKVFLLPLVRRRRRP